MKFLHYLQLLGAVIILGIVTWAIYTVRQYLPLLGDILLGALGLGIAATIPLTIAWVMLHLRQKNRDANTIHVQEHGAYVLYQGQYQALLPASVHVASYTAQLTAPRTQVQQVVDADEPKMLPAPLPINVRYEDVKPHVPLGHILVGIGRAGIETKERAVGACLWIVGLSGTGKTSTTVLRVEERRSDNHKFLGVDPHWFKPDSLTNAINAYASDFILPMAKTPEEAKKVLTAFLSEFNARKAGKRPQPWQKVTLLVDEVGALMDPTTPEEEEIKEMLPSIARICGQEARNFNMGGIFISQQATNLAWLRKVALMVIVHQLLQESEKRLATNNDVDVMKEMKQWPVGRTYVYGVGFQEGPRTVQQPFFTVPQRAESVSRMEDVFPASETHGNRDTEPGHIVESHVNVPSSFPGEPEQEKAEERAGNTEGSAIRETIRRMKMRGMKDREIAVLVGLAGRKYVTYKQICQELGFVQTVEQDA